MAKRPQRSRKRRPRRGKKPGGSGNKNLLLQSIGGGIVLILIVFLMAADTIDPGLGTIMGMIVVGVIFYFVSLNSNIASTTGNPMLLSIYNLGFLKGIFF